MSAPPCALQRRPAFAPELAFAPVTITTADGFEIHQALVKPFSKPPSGDKRLFVQVVVVPPAVVNFKTFDEQPDAAPDAFLGVTNQ